MTIDPRLIPAVRASAARLGISPIDLLTAMSYETGGKLDPNLWGGAGNRYLGLIQFGPQEQKTYGVKPDMPVADQVTAAERFLRDRGVKPGMGLADIYSTINAGAPRLYNRSDAANGGMPGTVADKVNSPEMAAHRRRAEALLRSHPPSFGPPSSVGPGPGSGAIPDLGWPTDPHATDQRGPFGTGGHLAPPTRNRIDDPLYPFNSFDHAPGYPAGPPPAALPHWLHPGLGMMRSFPDSLRDPAISSGYYSGDRFVPTPQAPDRPIARVSPNPFSTMPIAPEALSSFDPRSWLSPEQRSITGIDALAAPAAPYARPSALDDVTLFPSLLGGGTTPAPQSYPSSPFDTTSYDWRTGRWATPPVSGNPSPGDPGQLPFQKRALSSPEETGSSSALAAQAPGTWPLPGNGILSGLAPASAVGGNGILSGLFPDGASPSPGDGILGGLGPLLGGRPGSAGAEEDNHSAWAQMLQDLWLRHMQDDAAPDDSTR